MKRNAWKWCWCVIVAALVTDMMSVNAWADIDVKPQYDAHEPIVATVTITEVPEGAKLRGSINIEGASYIPAGDNVYHVWAKPGKYRIVAQGVWVLTNEIDVNGQKIPVLLDFGQYQYVKTFVVGEGDDDVVPPPPPPGNRTAVILEESEQRTTAQAILFQELALQIKPPKLQVLDDDQKSAQKYLPLLPASMSTVRPAMLVMAGETVVRVVPLPSSVAAVKELIDK